MFDTEIGNRRGKLYKEARSTWLTSGLYSKLQSILFHRRHTIGKDGKEAVITTQTIEYSITTVQPGWAPLPYYPDPFSENGDSGAFIFGEHADVVGLLVAGADYTRVSYFTHIRDVFEDVMAVTGAVDIRIMDSWGLDEMREWVGWMELLRFFKLFDVG